VLGIFDKRNRKRDAQDGAEASEMPPPVFLSVEPVWRATSDEREDVPAIENAGDGVGGARGDGPAREGEDPADGFGGDAIDDPLDGFCGTTGAPASAAEKCSKVAPKYLNEIGHSLKCGQCGCEGRFETTKVRTTTLVRACHESLEPAFRKARWRAPVVSPDVDEARRRPLPERFNMRFEDYDPTGRFEAQSLRTSRRFGIPASPPIQVAAPVRMTPPEGR
jgi:hypothetical protein